MNKCPFHDDVIKDIQEINSNIREIKTIILGDGNNGIINRIVRLEVSGNNISSFLFRIMNIIEAILIGFITIKVLNL